MEYEKILEKQKAEVNEQSRIHHYACGFLKDKYKIDFYNTRDRMFICRQNWIVSSLIELKFLELELVLTEWIKNPPPEEILDILRKTIKKSEKFILEKVYDYPTNLISLFVYFGLEEVLKKDIETKQKFFNETMESYNKLVAGKKIVNFVEEHMDDEYILRPMRIRIDMRKILDADKERLKK